MTLSPLRWSLSGFTLSGPTRAQPKLVGWCHTCHEIDALQISPTVQAFIRRRTTMPSADCCCRVRMNLFTLSLDSETYSSSPVISSVAFRAQPPNLRFASLIDMGFAIIGPLAQRSRLRSGSCTLARAFAPRFLQTPPHGDALALRYHFTSIRL